MYKRTKWSPPGSYWNWPFSKICETKEPEHAKQKQKPQLLLLHCGHQPLNHIHIFDNLINFNYNIINMAKTSIMLI